MMDMIFQFADLRFLVPLIIAALVFFTVLTLIKPYLESQQISERANLVVAERARLRAQQRAQLNEKSAGLREKPKGLMAQIVEALNLRKIFDVQQTRNLLRTAGLRSEKHLVTFLVVRAVAPIALGIFAFIYAGLVIDNIETAQRLGIAMGGVAAGYFLPTLLLNSRIQRRQESIRLAWSDALDLLLICVESGQSIEQAMNRVSLEIAKQSKPLAEELQLTTAELSYLGDRRQAYKNLATRTGLKTVKAVVTSLIQAEQRGTPLAQALRVLAQENRNDRMAKAEQKAASLSPKLTVPMIIFFLPVVGVVLLGPAYIEYTRVN